MSKVTEDGAAPGVVGRQWKCDNCGAWVLYDQADERLFDEGADE